MLTLLLATQMLYAFPEGKPVTYDVSVHFDGFVQVFGGKNADVQVVMQVEAAGLSKDAEGNPRVVSEIKDFSLTMNGAKFPLEPKNVTRYFPRTTISMTPTGKTLATDAPDIQLPIKLPGLHAKRFPDITYIPLEFPTDGVELNKEFTFKRPFGDSIVEYTVTPKSMNEDTATFDVAIKQSFTQFEDQFGNVVEEKSGKVKVTTEVVGKGDATFDRKRSLVSNLKIEADADSAVVDLKSSKQSERKLKTTLTIKARP